MSTKSRGRPPYENERDRKKRLNIIMLPEVQEMAKEIGEGNVSRGLELAVRELYGKHQTVR